MPATGICRQNIVTGYEGEFDRGLQSIRGLRESCCEQRWSRWIPFKQQHNFSKQPIPRSFSLTFCNSDSRSGSEVVLRLLVRGGSGDRSICSGRRRCWKSCLTAGSEERAREKDGSTRSRTLVAPRTSSPYFAYNGVTEQSAATRKRYIEPGPGHFACRGELNEWGCKS